jgi:hypothetical protein
MGGGGGTHVLLKIYVLKYEETNYCISRLLSLSLGDMAWLLIKLALMRILWDCRPLLWAVPMPSLFFFSFLVVS